MPATEIASKTLYTAEVLDARTQVWTRAGTGTPTESQPAAQAALDEVIRVVRQYHADGSFLHYARTRIRKDVITTTVIADRAI